MITEWLMRKPENTLLKYFYFEKQVEMSEFQHLGLIWTLTSHIFSIIKAKLI